MNYEEAARLHARARDPHAGKPIANNTRIVRVDVPQRPPMFAIRLHATNVVAFEESGTMHFETGGWETRTTVARMDMADGVRVFGHYGEDPAVFVKWGEGWSDGFEPYRVEGGLTVLPNGHMPHAGESHAEYERERERRYRERAGHNRAAAREKALDVIVGNPRGRWGWYDVRAGHVRVENGVIFSGQHPVAVCYPHPEQGVQANLLTVSQRALKRTRVGLELVERAVASGCKLVFAPHEQVIEETQNRRHA